MSTHSPGAMRAAVAILNARSHISTADGYKSTGELADFIERETRIVELIDAAQRVLRACDEATADDGAGAAARPAGIAPLIEELRAALRSVTAQPETVALPDGRRH